MPRIIHERSDPWDEICDFRARCGPSSGRHGVRVPSPLTKAQKSAAWMLELGNGEVFLFDIGRGSMKNIFALRPDFSKLDKVAVIHLRSSRGSP